MAQSMSIRPSRSSLQSFFSSISSRPSIRSSQCQFSLQQIRQESTRKRLKRKLKIAPSPAFTSSTEQYDHILFAPPSSAPNIYHTPLKFLPAHDPRRHMLSSMSSAPASITPTGTPLTVDAPNSLMTALKSVSLKTPTQTISHSESETALGPVIGPTGRKGYHLTEQDINEIRRLRLSDPKTWTVAKISQKFKCTEFFVRIVARNREAGKEHMRQMEEVQKGWGTKRREAREDRYRRQVLWGRG
ncbi:hypothetical protein P152DRAFT_457169 [Eremomyces bilateralis CBS 781.70]|uniref:60S ribosomal protein L20 n=1 Tax=Eremomyces bilateralis CBS 781.70 TaxID=1392243 RepID=A0A6G1G7D2_9PEZI|nr:uncharacterized protein P152DRAFT_457169 [Eremomyces bilateralis CBS 781.70]KAF1813800.1 hypothetical protein P152DRAFT_457169 [Eremomyces bilateralis CBS 781.70]